jgi:DDE superfamily endonuclease
LKGEDQTGYAADQKVKERSAMPILPTEIMTLLQSFAPLFTARTWVYVPVLVAGGILAPGRRMVSSVLRTMGLAQVPWFQNFHRVLNRAPWSSLAVSHVLLGLLITAFAPAGPLVVGVDDTIERRRGEKIAAKGIYRDPVRSSKSHTVKASGLRWVCMMLLVPIPWAKTVWALPFLTVLAPSERYHATRGTRHKTIVDGARQMIVMLRRWCPTRPLVIVADSHFAALEFLARCSRAPVAATVVTRLRLDAALYEPAPPRDPHKAGRPPLKGKRLPTLEQVRDDAATVWTRLTVPHWYGGQERSVEIVSQTAVWYHGGLPPVPVRWVLIRDPEGAFETQALLCTTLEASPLEIISWFVLRWQMEVTFEESRAHLGLETQRQWSDKAIARTTPAVFGLFSLVTLLAHRLLEQSPCPTRRAAWYAKTLPTFSDTLALVRRHLWTQTHFVLSPSSVDAQQIPRALLDHLAGLLCYAA